MEDGIEISQLNAEGHAAHIGRSSWQTAAHQHALRASPSRRRAPKFEFHHGGRHIWARDGSAVRCKLSESGINAAAGKEHLPPGLNRKRAAWQC